MQEAMQAAQYGDDASLLEKVDVKCDPSHAEQQSTGLVRKSKQCKGRRICIAMLLSLLAMLAMISAMMPTPMMQWRSCHRASTEAQQPVAVHETEGPTFLESLQEASPESLHELLHKYFPEKFQHGVFPSDHHALEALHQADAAVASTIARMAKRADNTTTSALTSTVFTSTHTSVSQSSTIVTTVTSTSSRAVTSTSQSSSAAASSTSTQSSTIGMSTSQSQRGISSSTTPLLPVTTSTSSAAQSSSVLSSSGGGSTTLSTTTAPTSSAPRSSTTRTSTFTSTNANGGVVVVTQTTVVGADAPTDPAGVSSTQPAGGLQTNAALSPKERSGKSGLLWGAAVGLALLA